MLRKDRKFHFIYKTTCLITGRFYIGMHSTDVLDDKYLGSGKQLQWSLKKHGRDSHCREVLEHCENRETLIIREKDVVNHHLLADDRCMNLAIGGEGGAVAEITQERKARVSAKMKGVPRGPMSEETKKKLSVAKKGRPLSEAAKAKMSASTKGRKMSEEQKALLSKVKSGRPMSQANKDALSKACIGKQISPEVKAKISQALVGRKLSEQHKSNISAGKLRVHLS